MARIQFSPIIVGLSGKVSDAVFSRWKGIPYIRSRVIPSNPQTAAQTAQRDALKYCLLLWQSVKSWAKAPWDLYATGYAWSGYNRYMDVNIGNVKGELAEVLTPAHAAYHKIKTPEWTFATGTISCTWTNDGGGATDYVFIAFHKLGDYVWTRGTDVLATALTASENTTLPAGDYVAALVCYDNVDLLYQESFNTKDTLT